MVIDESTSQPSEPIRNQNDDAISDVNPSDVTKKSKNKRSWKSKAKSANKSKSNVDQQNGDTSSNKQKKQSKLVKKITDTNAVMKVLIGYKPGDKEKDQIHDIMVYDIPVLKNPKQILEEFKVWAQFEHGISVV
ncbi:hypothetical protein RclHR1_05240009 [Rhizophagus clarus]|uniref:Uncharacterized protein n=1 Tax=Rhizophagus clarus TaxID=94130 RepID=A0A2Z6S3J2_9GLOM|nr:hypothetical protein RclHR1_05240009 [Rhizophagus clarus]